jgi:hypothetical protein
MIATLNDEVARCGVLLRTRAGTLKSNPAIKEITNLRNFVSRSIHKLGLNLEELRAGPGRPPGLIGS